jgi:hypothetical protein
MSFLNLEELPFVGMSYEFVGETQGAPFSAFIVNAKPGQGPHCTHILTLKLHSLSKAAPPSRSVIKRAK